MEDNNQTNVTSEFPPIREIDEGLTQLINVLRRETQVRNHINSALSAGLDIRPINSIIPDGPTNQFYFHDVFRNGPTRYNNATNTALENSLREQGGVRNVISDEGKKELVTDKYEKGKFMNTVCPILQEEFAQKDTVTVLPCNHCFYPEGIMVWLENNKAECPVCRYKLSSKEVSNRESESSEDDNASEIIDQHDDNEENDEDDEENDGTHDLSILGNSIQQPLLNPLLTRILENIVRENMRNRENNTSASSHDDSSEMEQENSNLVNSANTLEEDSIDLQMAIYASMIEDGSGENDSDID